VGVLFPSNSFRVGSEHINAAEISKLQRAGGRCHSIHPRTKCKVRPGRLGSDWESEKAVRIPVVETGHHHTFLARRCWKTGCDGVMIGRALGNRGSSAWTIRGCGERNPPLRPWTEKNDSSSFHAGKAYYGKRWAVNFRNMFTGMRKAIRGCALFIRSYQG
jgi:tRNA-dihydrouridine synthase